MRWKISYNPSSMQEYLDEILQYCVANASKALQNDKERVWTSCSSEYAKLAKQLGNDEEMVKAFSLIINEILLLQMHTFLLQWMEVNGYLKSIDLILLIRGMSPL